MKLGVCYYPEHWPESDWAEDARMMREAGLTHVRIGEFAWARIEPRRGAFEWGWLDRIVDLLHAAGLEVTLGTPTATPPKWLVDAHPDILPLDEHGHPRRFGSRRHYCFSSRTYRAESSRIVEALARRYGEHPGVTMWQTDNEYGHHGSDESFSTDAVEAFRDWLEARYTDIQALNAAWGTVFWSQIYNRFGEIDPPGATVTEANPSQRLDWRRFCSDQMCSFNQAQVDIIRRYSPGRPVTHNFIGDFFRLDHRDISRSLDIATWDSYPIGLLSESKAPKEHKARWLRAGDPDFAAFNHDVFRACAPRWAVMEQQPGPVNWATYNAAPAPGMVRLWTWEAFAHGADFVSYFRWRQAPFAQEQMHAGLLAPDRKPQPVLDEIRQIGLDAAQIQPLHQVRADVAILLDYPSVWQHEIQPQGNLSGPLEPTRAVYSACRRLGLNVDFVFDDSDMGGYKLILVPSVPVISEAAWNNLKSSGATVFATALTGSRTINGRIPDRLAPGPLGPDLNLRVEQLETLPPFEKCSVRMEGGDFDAGRWHETIATSADVRARFSDGSPAWVRNGRFQYLACWPDEDLMLDLVQRLCSETGIPSRDLGPDLRLRRAGDLVFAFNYGPGTLDLSQVGAPVDPDGYEIGSRHLTPCSLAVWRAGS
jgi:beta-galactosidase